MNSWSRCLAGVVLLILVIACPASAGDMGYYRIASTGETRIISLSDDGALTWTNVNPDASCRVVWSFWLEGPWTTSFDMTNVVATGAVRIANVPVPERPPNHCICVHNLFLIKKAMQRLQQEQEREPWDMVTLWDLEPYFEDGLPSCPAGGIYAVTIFGADPFCSIGPPHQLPAE